MPEQKQKYTEKLQLSGFSTFNIPSISHFPNGMGDSLKFITTEKNIGSYEKDYMSPQRERSSVDDQQDSLALRIQAPEPTTASGKKKRMGCTCKKTFCLKMYCECFANNKTCNEDCICCDCKNISGNDDIIEQAKGNVKQKGTHNCSLAEKRCNCKKSFCQKKYCECFNAGVACSESCNCVQCCNKDDFQIKRPQSLSSIKQDLPQSGTFLDKSMVNLENYVNDNKFQC